MLTGNLNVVEKYDYLAEKYRRGYFYGLRI